MNNLPFLNLRRATMLFGIVVSFLSAAAQAQWVPDFSSIDVARIASQAESPCNQQGSKRKFSIPQLSVFQRYSQARRDREQEVLVVFCVATHKNAGCPLSTSPSLGQFMPAFLELESSDGLTVRYREGEKYQPQRPGAPIPAGAITFLKVRIPRDAALGARTLRGKLTFQAIQPVNSPQQQLDLTIPLSVVEHSAKVKDTGWPFKSPSHLWRDIRAGLAVPFLATAYFFLVVGCGLADCDL